MEQVLSYIVLSNTSYASDCILVASKENLILIMAMALLVSVLSFMLVILHERVMLLIMIY